MERLWSPWRHEYITNSEQPRGGSCFFCAAHQEPQHDADNLVLQRGAHNLVILNRYPYTSGHLMVAPCAHIGEFDSSPKEVTDEMMDLLKGCQSALREVYHPQGFNLGMNLGSVAGAGVADHIHMHILPRWGGDTNFMSSVAETRVLSETLSMTYQKLAGKI